MIDSYITESLKQIVRTNAQVVRAIQNYDIANKNCRDITSADIAGLTGELSDGRTPQTVANYRPHLASNFVFVRPAYGYLLDKAGHGRRAEGAWHDGEKQEAHAAAGPE